MVENGLYLYCVTDTQSSEEPTLQGIGGRDVFTLSSQKLKAIVSCCESSIASDDPRFISEWIFTHETVVEHVWKKYQTIVPFAFGTVIIAKDGKTAHENMCEWLKKEENSLTETLERLNGKSEYGVQILWDSDAVASRVTQNDNEVQKIMADIKSKGKGYAYLMRQKLEALVASRLEIAANAYFSEFYRRIQDLVEKIRIEKIKKEEPPQQMLANFSCLMHEQDVSKLGTELDKMSRVEGVSVRFTGPWPPYSFVLG